MKRRYRLGLVIIVLFGLTAGAVYSLSSSREPLVVDEPSIQIDLRMSDPTTVKITSVYDLRNTSDRERFQSLRENDTTRRRMTRRTIMWFNNSTRPVNPPLEIGQERLDTAERGSQGIASVSANISGLSLHGHDALALEDPFVRTFDADRQIRVTVPDRFPVKYTSPSPSAVNDTMAIWGPDANVSDLGFQGQAESDSALVWFWLLVVVFAFFSAMVISLMQDGY